MQRGEIEKYESGKKSLSLEYILLTSSHWNHKLLKILGVSIENLGVSNENLGFPTKIWGPMRNWGPMRI